MAPLPVGKHNPEEQCGSPGLGGAGVFVPVTVPVAGAGFRGE